MVNLYLTVAGLQKRLGGFGVATGGQRRFTRLLVAIALGAQAGSAKRCQFGRDLFHRARTGVGRTRKLAIDASLQRTRPVKGSNGLPHPLGCRSGAGLHQFGLQLEVYRLHLDTSDGQLQRALAAVTLEPSLGVAGVDLMLEPQRLTEWRAGLGKTSGRQRVLAFSRKARDARQQLIDAAVVQLGLQRTQAGDLCFVAASDEPDK